MQTSHTALIKDMSPDELKARAEDILIELAAPQVDHYRTYSITEEYNRISVEYEQQTRERL